MRKLRSKDDISSFTCGCLCNTSHLQYLTCVLNMAEVVAHTHPFKCAREAGLGVNTWFTGLLVETDVSYAAQKLEW